MNLREEQLILRCDVSQERFEALLTNEAIRTKFARLVENAQVRKAIKKLVNAFEKLNHLADRGQENKKTRKISFEELYQSTKLGSIEVIVRTKADDIFFDGKRVEEVVEENLTEAVFIEILFDAIQDVEATRRNVQAINEIIMAFGLLGDIFGEA